jgi:uncharacterized protein (TIGR00255 family)
VVTVSVRDEGGGAVQAVHADVELARGYARALEELRKSLGLAEPVSLALVSGQPGVLTVGEGLPDSDALWAALKPGLESALLGLVESRAREGAAIGEDLRNRVDTLQRITNELRELAREQPEQYKKRLAERIERLGLDGVDGNRVAQEVALFADKVDVAEELTRLGAHLAELRRLVAQDGPSGRRLDFLVQEVNREINTIGAKSQSAPAAARVVDAKAELERLREQIQNVE